MNRKNRIFTIIVLLSLFIFEYNNMLFAANNRKNSNLKKQKAQDNNIASQGAVVYVFPADTEKQSFKPVKRVLTGIFTEKRQKKALEADKKESEKKEKLELKEAPPRTLNAKTIAWITPMGICYHDPTNNCLNILDRLWVEEKKEIVGLEPCPDCFKKINKIPEFIKKEPGNLEIAEANALLMNNDFIEWAKSKLPIKDMNFISSTKLLVFPSVDMASVGMYELAIQVQNAYLRKTWRVIEVQVKSNPEVTEYVSSFSPSSILLGVNKTKPVNDTNQSVKKEPRKPRLFR